MSLEVHIDAAKIAALFAPFESSSEPGVAVGVAHRGRPIFRRGYGLASVELPVALSPTIRMRIGSTSKHFCCLAIMLLAEEGRLSPTDGIRRHLPELPAWAEPITLAHLMSHTGGMRCSIDLIFQTGGVGQTVSTAEQLDLLAGLDSVNFAPGESWNYCNGGYVLLSEVVERVGGRPYAEFLGERILAPAGLFDTALKPSDTDLMPNCASLHVPDGAGGFRRGVFGVAIRGEGGMVSTVDDMLAWLVHMRAPKVGSAASWAAMTTPARLNNGHSTGYGFGLFMEDYRGVRLIHHAGGVMGGASQMLTAPDHELDVVIMTNRAGVVDPVGLSKRVIDALVSGLAPASEDDRAVAPLEGVYYAGEGRLIALAAHDGLQIADLYQVKAPVRRGADGALRLDAIAAATTIRPDASGEEIEVTEWGQSVRYRRLAPPSQPSVLAGRWRCASPDIALAARATGGGQEVRLDAPWGSQTFQLTTLGPDLWSCATGDPLRPFGGVLEREGETLYLTTGRTRRLVFKPAA